MRISRPRRDFEQDGINFIDKEATENSTPMQGQSKINYLPKPKKVLDIGL